MDWITGISVENKKLVAVTVDRAGSVGRRDLQELVTLGVPTSQALLRKDGVVTNFQDWQLIPAGDYLIAHDVPLCADAQSHHQVYEFQVRQTTFQVPALVLMRALFYPGKHLLANMFRPQGLDNLGFLDEDNLHLLNGLVRSRGTGGYKWDNDAVRARLRWMYVYPSAYRMAHSVHEHALSGAIGITLPEATIQGIVTGKKVGDTYYVTDLAVKKIEPQERAFDHLQNISSNVISDVEVSSTLTKVISESGHLCPLSDDEWHAIQPILVPRSLHRCLLPQRDLLDAVLFKLQTGTPWRKLLCKSGTHENAAQAYRTWKERGTFGPAIEQLRIMRCSA